MPSSCPVRLARARATRDAHGATRGTARPLPTETLTHKFVTYVRWQRKATEEAGGEAGGSGSTDPLPGPPPEPEDIDEVAVQDHEDDDTLVHADAPLRAP